MAEKGKVTALLLVVLVIASLSLAGGSFYLMQKEKTNNKVLQDKLSEASLKYTMVEKELRESKESVAMLRSKLEGATKQINTLTVDLQREKTLKDEARIETERLQAELEKQRGLKVDLEKKFNQGQEEIKGLQTQLKKLDSKKMELEAEIKNLQAQSQEAVELGEIVVAADDKPATKAESPTLEGNVVVINEDYNFAVINLGAKDGVGLGDVFSVYHDNEYLGDVEVERVHDSMSAAGFISENLRHKVSEDDKVVSVK